MSITLLDAAGPVAPGQHLFVEYRTKLDANSQNGETLTNVAGATRWYNDDSGNAARVEINRVLTDGTVGVDDHQDAHSLAVLLSGFFFEKTVRNVTSGADPARTAVPGDVLHYTLRLQATDSSFIDSMTSSGAPLPTSAPGTASNAGETFAPYESKQHELGVKYEHGTFMTTLALFQIEKPAGELGANGVYSVQAEQRNRGLELSVFGEVATGTSTHSLNGGLRVNW